MLSKKIKRMHYKNFPEDIRPSEQGLLLATDPAPSSSSSSADPLFSHQPTVT